MAYVGQSPLAAAAASANKTAQGIVDNTARERQLQMQEDRSGMMREEFDLRKQQMEQENQEREALTQYRQGQLGGLRQSVSADQLALDEEMIGPRPKPVEANPIEERQAALAKILPNLSPEAQAQEMAAFEKARAEFEMDSQKEALSEEIGKGLGEGLYAVGGELPDDIGALIQEAQQALESDDPDALMEARERLTNARATVYERNRALGQRQAAMEQLSQTANRYAPGSGQHDQLTDLMHRYSAGLVDRDDLHDEMFKIETGKPTLKGASPQQKAIGLVKDILGEDAFDLETGRLNKQGAGMLAEITSILDGSRAQTPTGLSTFMSLDLDAREDFVNSLNEAGTAKEVDALLKSAPFDTDTLPPNILRMIFRARQDAGPRRKSMVATMNIK